MTEPEKTPTQEEQTSEEAKRETATLEEMRAKDEREFAFSLYRLVAITGLISFFGPILFFFLVVPLGIAASSDGVGAELLARVLCLLFLAIPISAIVGLFSCLLLWGAPTTTSDLKTGIVFSALADVFGLGISVLAPFALNPFP